jgi:hypothetical protein
MFPGMQIAEFNRNSSICRSDEREWIQSL